MKAVDSLRLSVRVAGTLAVIAVIVLAAMGSTDYVAFIIVALIPTMIAGFLERPGQRAATISIGALTISTALPLMMGAVMGRESLDLLGSTMVWMLIAAAICAGLAIYLVMPALTVWADDLRTDARVKALKTKQEAIEREWGAEARVTTN